jgi:hypothetical protein
MAYAQGVAAAWSTLKVRPATVIVPVRAALFGFAETVKSTLPFPVPDAPLSMAIQFAPLVAVHAQPDVVATATVSVPPAAAND